ncbi:hypothetical protein [Novosphingobium silvae]|uniref:hypothetical protein n=1 Tax=Novosphingobium silvae TaxID=2692619 RepID=UPI003B023D72
MIARLVQSRQHGGGEIEHPHGAVRRSQFGLKSARPRGCKARRKMCRRACFGDEHGRRLGLFAADPVAASCNLARRPRAIAECLGDRDQRGIADRPLLPLCIMPDAGDTDLGGESMKSLVVGRLRHSGWVP